MTATPISGREAADAESASPGFPSSCRLYLDGAWTTSERIEPVLNKYTQAVVSNVHYASREQVATAVRTAYRAFRADPSSPYERGLILDRTADLVAARAERFTAAVVAEAGFPLQDARNEVRRCIATLRLSAEEARRFAGAWVPLEGAADQAGRLGFTLRVPLGVVCAITPFNSPLNTVVHKLGPALAAGNTAILKASPHTPMCACLLVETLNEAGLRPGMLSLLHGGADVVNWLLDEPAVHFFAFTGSTEAGRAIQARAGLRRTQMELGSIAHVVLCDDADLDAALPRVVNAAYRKAGQVCTSIQTLLVHRSIAAEVERRLTRIVAALPYGDPADPRTVVGPVISLEAADRIERWIGDAVAAGTRLLSGGTRHGSVIAPTLLADLPAATPLGCQEIFGPVMVLRPFDHLQEAVDAINALPYGLAAGLFTNRLDAAFEAIRKLDVGGVHINDTSSSRVDLMPYGGTKNSGFGREGPAAAIREMSEERMVTLRTARH